MDCLPYIARNKVLSHLLTFMLRRTRSTRTCVFAGLVSRGINPPEYIYNTLIVPDGGLGGGVYRESESAQDSCRIDAGMRECDELSSCRSIVCHWPTILELKQNMTEAASYGK